MKTHLKFLGIIFILPCLALAQQEEEPFDQFKKGKNLIGVQFNMGWSGYYGLTGQESLRYGRFVADKLVVGSELRHSFSGNRYHAGEIAPFIRYYFREKKFSPFVEAQYSYGESIYKASQTGEYKTQHHSGFLGGGLAYTPFKHFGIEIYGGYTLKETNYYSPNPVGNLRQTSGGLSTGVRLNFHF